MSIPRHIDKERFLDWALKMANEEHLQRHKEAIKSGEDGIKAWNPSPIRLLLFKTMAIAFGLLIGLLIGEIGLRAWLFGADVFDFRMFNSFRPIRNSGHIQSPDDLRVLYELKPNLDTWFKLQSLRTNSRGLRDKEYALTKLPDTYRVAVIGNSFTFGEGVAIENVYHSVLEDSLNALSDNLHYEFINFGVGGYNLLNYLGVIEQKAWAYKPDLILIGFNNSDTRLPPKSHGKKKCTGRKVRRLMHHSQIVRSINGIAKRTMRAWRRARQNELTKQVKFVTEMFAKFRTVSEQHHIPILIFYLTMKVAPPGENEWIQQLAAEHDFDFVDSSPVVDAVENIREFWIHSTDGHPNAVIHRKYAKVLMPYFFKVFN